MAAHPQQDDETPAAEPVDVSKNPFPSTMTVPGEDGTTVEVELAVLNGVVFAPALDSLSLAPHVRQYVTQYCASWSSSVLTVGKLAQSWPAPPRRAQVVFGEAQLRAMLGLAEDEHLVAVVTDPLTCAVRFVVDSPRLPPKPHWNMEPLPVGLPIAAHYESPGVAQ